MSFAHINNSSYSLQTKVGVAVLPSNQLGEITHVGAVYANTDGSLHFAHLAFHYILRDEPMPADKGYWWSDCRWLSSPEAQPNAIFLAEFIESVVSNENEISYGIHPPEQAFDTAGVLIDMADDEGLTCATFVAALFKDAGFPVVDLNSWESRAGDDVWKEQIVAILRDGAPQRADQIRDQDVYFRLRPDEIAVAGAAEIVPLTMEQAEAEAAALRKACFG